MLKLLKQRSVKIGQPPGTLIHIGKEQNRSIAINVIDYDSEKLEEIKVHDVSECFPFKESPTVTWINVDGIHDPEIVKALGDYFGMHSLVLEDIMNTGQRPKLEDYDSYLYIVLKMLSLNSQMNEIVGEQLSFILGENFLITFQENERDVFDVVRDRLRKSKGRIRKMGADYLMYSLLDTIVDNYFTIMEKYGIKIEEIEEIVLSDTSQKTLQAIYMIKREMVFLRNSIWPLREVTSRLERDESELIAVKTRLFLRDVYDHTIEIVESAEAYREMVAGLLEIYLSNLSNRMNDVMKTLTIFASIFIPLTFLVGVYGMNFDYMPELSFRWSYPILLVIMFIMGGTMVYYFRKKGWL